MAGRRDLVKWGVVLDFPCWKRTRILEMLQEEVGGFLSLPCGKRAGLRFLEEKGGGLLVFLVATGQAFELLEGTYCM
jgi:hypothetical protein